MKFSKREKKALKTSAAFIRADEIVNEVSEERGVPLPLIFGPKRSRTIARARQWAMVRIRNETDLSLPEIGDIFGRDHTTVLFACRKHAS